MLPCSTPGDGFRSSRSILAGSLDRVAALNCNFLNDGHGALHYVIMDLWMQLIWQAADEHKNVPRVALETRELKSRPASPRT